MKNKFSIDTVSLIIIPLFLIVIILISSFGPVKLDCSRVEEKQVNCLLTRTVVLGFINQSQTSLSNLTEARVDGQIKIFIEADIETGAVSERKQPIYGVLLIGDENMILNGYSYNQQKQEEMVKQINNFLTKSTETTIHFQYRNYWLDVITLSSLGFSLSWLVKILLSKKTKKKSFEDNNGATA